MSFFRVTYSTVLLIFVLLLYHIIVRAAFYWRCISQGLKAWVNIFVMVASSPDRKLTQKISHTARFSSLQREVPKLWDSLGSFSILKRICVYKSFCPGISQRSVSNRLVRDGHTHRVSIGLLFRTISGMSNS